MDAARLQLTEEDARCWLLVINHQTTPNGLIFAPSLEADRRDADIFRMLAWRRAEIEAFGFDPAKPRRDV